MTNSYNRFSYSDMRLIHSAGPVALDYKHNGYIVSGGSDCFVKIIREEGLFGNMKEPSIMECHTGSITCVSIDQKSEYFASGSEDGTVVIYRNLENPEYVSHIVNITVPVRQIVFHPKENMVYVIGDELEMRCINIENTNLVEILKGHTKFVKCICMDSQGTSLVSLDCGGNFKVWSVGYPHVCVNTIYGLSKSTLNRELVSIDWAPDGHVIAIPNGNCIDTVCTKTWKEAQTFSCPDNTPVDSEFSIQIAKYIHHGLSLVYTGSHKTYIWDTNNTTLLKTIENESSIYGVRFISEKSLILFSDTEGRLMQYEFCSSELSSPQELEVDEHMHNKNQLSKQMNVPDNNKNIGEECSLDIRDGDSESEGYLLETKDNLSSPIINEMDRQKAFQPGSTPYANNKRFLVFNDIGTIVSRVDDIHYIDIEFHGNNTHRPIRFQDRHMLDIGVINKYGAVLSNNPQTTAFGLASKMENKESIIRYIPFGSWTSNGEWCMTLPNGESALSISMCGKKIVVVTNNCLVRVISFSSVQNYVFSLPGDILCSSGYKNNCIFIYHSHMLSGWKSNQDLSYLFYDIAHSRTISEGRVPLSIGSRVNWVGMIEESTPLVLDSHGVLRALIKGLGFQWVQILDYANLKDVTGNPVYYWPISAEKDSFTCTVLKIQNTNTKYNVDKDVIFPTCLPRPTIAHITYALPFLDNGDHEYEKVYFLKLLMNRYVKDTYEDEEVEEDKIVLGMIRRSIENGKLIKALDLCTLLNLKESFDIAAQMASYSEQTLLLEKIEIIKNMKPPEVQSNRENKNEQKRPFMTPKDILERKRTAHSVYKNISSS